MSTVQDIRAVIFDVNGTLVDIETDEHADQIFRAAGRFLTYQGIDLRREQLRHEYFAALKAQLGASHEEYPEFDAVAIWRAILDEHATEFTCALPGGKREWLPLALAEMCRGISRHRLRLYPHAREVLDLLRPRLPLAVVTDAQSPNARGELHKVGILDYFETIVVSGDHGFRKPDRRLFQLALDELGVAPEHAVHVGNDVYRDIHGASRAGMRTILFDSPQGRKEHPGTVPDHTIKDWREFPALLGL